MERQYYRPRAIPGSKQPTEKRRCDKCGNVTNCILFPTRRGPNSGALCLLCLAQSFKQLKEDPNW